ncbi:hypothetical protein [uncultured Tateyamaria sp.]|uniref:hypothetical protein n=1 Tax=uncultured Tateyamaria sp. TaxID=455651 RepID=UPI00261E4C6A|nr:hypothetical protein [uncultured Tateyamaria sp.]
MTMISTAIQTGERRYQPHINMSHDAQINQRRSAFLVGAVAVGLPTAMILVGLLLSTCFYDSISHYYYAQFWGSVFIGCLLFIGTYLLAWQGHSDGERILANFAAPFAWGVALFPTAGAGCTEPTWEGRVFADLALNDDIITATFDSPFALLPWTSTAHFISATILFVVLAYFSRYVFTRIVPERDIDPATGDIRPEKLRRNRIYRACGWVMVASIAAIGSNIVVEKITREPIPHWNDLNGTLIFEAIALYAFGYSWMVKGRFWDKRHVDQVALTAGDPITTP